jgi:hypothetical protein
MVKLSLFLPVLIDIFAPLAAYYLLHLFGIGDVWALALAGSLSGFKAFYDLIRRRSIDLSIAVFGMFALTLVLVGVTQDARFILIKPSLYIELAACYILMTTFGKPFLLKMAEPFATEGDALRVQAWKNAWETSGVFKKRMRIANALCGGAAALEGIARTMVVLNMPISRSVLWSNLPLLLFVVFCGLLGRFYLKKTIQQVMSTLL